MPNLKLTDQKIVEIARAHLEPLKLGKNPRPKVELAKEMKLSQKTVGRAITEAFRKRLISIETRFIPSFETDDSLARALQAKFPRLKLAIVARMPKGIDSDKTHRNLGYAMARQIQGDPFFFRDGDVVGLGSGRGTYFTIAALNELDNVQVGEISLMSLTGSLFSQRSKDRENFLFDADIHAALLAQHFLGQIQVRPICSPIAQSIQDRAKVIRETWLGEDYDKHVPTHAIVGVGVLAEQHRFCQEVTSGQKAPVLRSISDDLKTLVRIVGEITRSYDGKVPYCPVADICNRLLVVPHPDDLASSLRRRVSGDVEKLVSKINAHLITATKTQLSRVQNVILVAGTPIKARAILSLLQHSVAKVHTLCTDSEVAEALLELRW
jgi:DNA-binding transcriptional regulator LsrR (DeoR family)